MANNPETPNPTMQGLEYYHINRYTIPPPINENKSPSELLHEQVLNEPKGTIPLQLIDAGTGEKSVKLRTFQDPNDPKKDYVRLGKNSNEPNNNVWRLVQTEDKKLEIWENGKLVKTFTKDQLNAQGKDIDQGIVVLDGVVAITGFNPETNTVQIYKSDGSEPMASNKMSLPEPVKQKTQPRPTPKAPITTNITPLIIEPPLDPLIPKPPTPPDLPPAPPKLPVPDHKLPPQNIKPPHRDFIPRPQYQPAPPIPTAPQRDQNRLGPDEPHSLTGVDFTPTNFEDNYNPAEGDADNQVRTGVFLPEPLPIPPVIEIPIAIPPPIPKSKPPESPTLPPPPPETETPKLPTPPETELPPKIDKKLGCIFAIAGIIRPGFEKLRKKFTPIPKPPRQPPTEPNLVPPQDRPVGPDEPGFDPESDDDVGIFLLPEKTTSKDIKPHRFPIPWFLPPILITLLQGSVEQRNLYLPLTLHSDQPGQPTDSAPLKSAWDLRTQPKIEPVKMAPTPIYPDELGDTERIPNRISKSIRPQVDVKAGGPWIDHYSQADMENSGAEATLVKAGYNKDSEEYKRAFDRLVTTGRMVIAINNPDLVKNNPHRFMPGILKTLFPEEANFIIQSYIKDPGNPIWQLFADINILFNKDDPVLWEKAKTAIMQLMEKMKNTYYIDQPQSSTANQRGAHMPQ